MTESMISRFEGEEGCRRLSDLLRAQIIANGDTETAAALANISTLLELQKADVLIQQNSAANDLFLILTGSVRVIVNGRDVAIRQRGEHVGEMAIIDSSAPRSATVIAAEPCLVAKITEADFVRLAASNPSLWRALALQLCRRLNERRRFHAEPNVKPVIFIGSSSEQLPVAEALANAIPSGVADVVLWSKGVFGPSKFSIDDLDAQLRSSDFAALIGAADDQVTSRDVQSDAPRDNVIFELGLFMGALTRFRTFLLIPKEAKVKIPTDLLGLTTVRYDAAATDPGTAVKTAAEEIIEAISKIGPK